MVWPRDRGYWNRAVLFTERSCWFAVHLMYSVIRRIAIAILFLNVDATMMDYMVTVYLSITVKQTFLWFQWLVVWFDIQHL